MDLITGPLDKYDYMTFGVVLGALIAGFYLMIQIGGLPGRLAERRKHPHAESVKLMGWIGLFTVFPWVHALIWAYHDSITIDVRKFLGRHDAENADIRGTGPQSQEAASPSGSTRQEPTFPDTAAKPASQPAADQTGAPSA